MSEERWAKVGLTKSEQAFLRFSLGEGYKEYTHRPSNLFMLAYSLGYNQALVDKGLVTEPAEAQNESFEEWCQRNNAETMAARRGRRALAHPRGPRPHPAEPKVEDS